MIEDSKLLLFWGISVFLGWLTTAAGYLVLLDPSLVLITWSILLGPPLFVTLSKLRGGGDSNKLWNFWAGITVIIMLQNFLVSTYLIFSYFTLWLIIGSIGCHYTSNKLPPPSEKTYLYGTILNALTIPFVYLIPLRYVAVLAAFVQAGPIFWDWWKFHG